MAHEKTKRRGIQSVEIGMRVFSTVAAMPGPCSLTAIARGAGLSASQAHRYLSSLMAVGMLRQENHSGLYDMDAGAISIGLAALSRINIFANADVHVGELVRDTRRTAMITVWGNAGPTIVRWYPGRPPVITSLALGSILPLLGSATGQIFYAFGDPDEMERQASLIDVRDPSKVPADLPKLRAALRQRYIASSAGALTPGLRALASPVLDLQGRLVLVVTLISSSAIPATTDASARDSLIATCRRLTESIGGSAGGDLVRSSLPQPATPPKQKAKRRARVRSEAAK
jgi:DNA-binding IclR family transcriptional regulator